MTHTITRRSQNLGFGWTNRPVQKHNQRTGYSYLVIDTVDEPGVTGSVRNCVKEYDSARKINSNNDWSRSWFLSGQRVVGDLHQAEYDLFALAAGEVHSVQLETED